MKNDRPTTDCRRLLKILYDYIGYPAGCRINDNPPYGGVFIPHAQLSVMRLVRKELLARQVVKSIVTEEMFLKFNDTIRDGNVRNIWDLRDRINILLNLYGAKPLEKAAEQLVGTNKLRGKTLPHPRDVVAYLVVGTNEVLENDRQNHWFVDHDDYLHDALTGVRYPKNRLKVAKLKEKPDEKPVT
jgi:hypothetical protein